MDKHIQLLGEIKEFVSARDWNQFHDPKNLAEAISIESNELLEKFLWKTTEQSKYPDDAQLQEIKEEIADIYIYLTLFCDSLDIDVNKEALSKIKQNEAKYPVSKARGKHAKYDKL